jgi:hypothetical protein
VGGRPPQRFRTTETYIHWDRGLAIVAGMIGIVLLFTLLLIALPIGQARDEPSTAGLATVQPAAATPVATRTAVATAAPPPTGPDQPRLQATAREYPFVRRGPGINFAAVQNLQRGQRVEVVGRSADRLWLRIVLPTNASERGWVSADLLAVEGDVNSVPEVRE